MTDPRYEEAAWRAVEIAKRELEQAEEQMKTASGEFYTYAKGRYDAARPILAGLQLDEEDPNTESKP